MKIAGQLVIVGVLAIILSFSDRLGDVIRERKILRPVIVTRSVLQLYLTPQYRWRFYRYVNSHVVYE